MLVKTHLIVTSQHEEYIVKWHGSLAKSNPLFKNNMPIFILISGKGRMELNTLDIPYLEKIAKNFTSPKGRGAITTDKTYIYLKVRLLFDPPMSSAVMECINQNAKEIEWRLYAEAENEKTANS